MTVVNKFFQQTFVLAITTILFTKISLSQQNVDYSYLIACFKDPAIDSFNTDIDGIGEIKSINYTSDSVEAALSFYDIPQDKKNKSTGKLAQVATDRHIQTWKNNSKIILYDKYKVGLANIIDLRLHLLIEDIYMQVIIISEKNKIYELTSFRDTVDKAFFDKLNEKVKKKTCLQQ